LLKALEAFARTPFFFVAKHVKPPRDLKLFRQRIATGPGHRQQHEQEGMKIPSRFFSRISRFSDLLPNLRREKITHALDPTTAAGLGTRSKDGQKNSVGKTVIAEETDPDKIKVIRFCTPLGISEEESKFLVHFHIEGIRPLIGNE
jgi:hypothetical protein